MMCDNKIHKYKNRIVNLYQPHVRPSVRGKDNAKVDRYSSEFDLTQNKHKDELIRTIDWLVDLLVETNKRANKIERIALKLYKKRMSKGDSGSYQY